MAEERIQKVLAQTGQYSRRQVEALIDQRQIKVNGIVVTQKGKKIDPAKDRVQVEGKTIRLKASQESTAVLLNKPRKVVVTRSDPEDRKTVYDLLPEKYAHLKPVGRLDFNSQGALILTNDGDLIYKLTHPSFECEKIYEVKVSSEPTDKDLMRLRRGVVIDGYRTLPAEVEVIHQRKSSTLLKFKLKEGKNRQIRKMCKAVGLTVKELRRVSIGPVKIKSLRSGRYRLLTIKEWKALLEL